LIKEKLILTKQLDNSYEMIMLMITVIVNVIGTVNIPFETFWNLYDKKS